MKINIKMLGDNMTEEEKKELQKIIEEINEEAKNVVEDYVKNPSELSGSTIQIHETSPFRMEENNTY